MGWANTKSQAICKCMNFLNKHVHTPNIFNVAEKVLGDQTSGLMVLRHRLVKILGLPKGAKLSDLSSYISTVRFLLFQHKKKDVHGQQFWDKRRENALSQSEWHRWYWDTSDEQRSTLALPKGAKLSDFSSWISTVGFLLFWQSHCQISFIFFNTVSDTNAAKLSDFFYFFNTVSDTTQRPTNRVCQ